MKTPEWLKPAFNGAVVGAAVLAVGGFTLGGWVTGGTAEKMASTKARMEVVAALVPVCLEQSQQDPRVVETLAEIKSARKYQRNQLVMNAGWATMPGSSNPNRGVATACLEELATHF